MSIEAMKLALEALETYHGYMEPLTTVFGGPRVPAEQSTTGKVETAITSLRQALEEALAKQEQGEPVVCCQEYDTCLKPCTPRGKHLAQQEQSVSVGEPDDLMIAYMSGLYDGKKQAKQEQGEPDELKHIDERDYLLDVDEKAWRSLIENRGGCRCHLSPPCGACTDPISEEEMNEVGYTYTTPQPAQKPLTNERLELVGHADLAINNIYIFNGYGEDVPEGRTPIYAGYKAAHGIKE